MSRIGKKEIAMPTGVEVNIQDRTVTVKGPKGTLSIDLEKGINVEVKEMIITVTAENETLGSLHGLTRALIANMVKGVSEGFTKKLEINGVGYRAAKQGNKLALTLGYSHPVEFMDTQDVTYEVPDPNTIIVKGIDKQAVGQMAAEIREKRLPEPYKGKGIKYAEEHIRRKEGKAGGKK